MPGTVPTNRHCGARPELATLRKCQEFRSPDSAESGTSHAWAWEPGCVTNLDRTAVGGGHYAQPLCQFALFETFSSFGPRQTLSGRGILYRQVGRDDTFSAHAAAAPAPGEILAVRPMRCALDAGSRPAGRHRIVAAPAAGGLACDNYETLPRHSLAETTCLPSHRFRPRARM
jgi:hypothetical protein